MQRRSQRSFWLYRAFERIGRPRSYVAKLTAAAFVAMHLPLIVTLIYALAADRLSRGGVLAALLGATAAGFGALVLALRQLTAPILLAGDALRAYVAEREIVPLPVRYRDECGVLLANVDYALRTFHATRVQLEGYAVHDFLTGLLYRRAADDRLRHEVKAARQKDRPLCAALMDIDHFTAINDRHGHAAGDQVLVALSRHLQAALGDHDWVARWGGDEFLLVISLPLDPARAVLDRIRAGVERLRVMSRAGEIGFTVSIGMAAVTPAEGGAAAIDRAHAALDEAKRRGRNRLQPAGANAAQEGEGLRWSVA